MRRLLTAAAVLLAGALLVALPATGADDGPYKVRAIFDNGGFLVKDEEVRVAGATVGTVESVDVSGEDEIVSLVDGPRADPGKAVVVMKIDNEAFKDFRQDASCIIRPQSLIGEKFVDCSPTQPRAPGSEAPPELEVIEEGPGEGQRLLPLENNGKAVDLDLIQNINRAPYRDRFRLILNDLGAGLAARGDDLGAVIDRANPALRQTNRVLKILAGQRRQLASLANDGDAVLEPLAENRTSVTGFFRNAGIAGEAAAERRDEIEAGLQKFPETLRQVRLTMTDLKEFADQGTPLAEDIAASAPNLSKATQKLAPFARNAIPAFTTLGDAAEQSGPLLVEADPLLVDLVSLATGSVPIGRDLSALLGTFSDTNGFQALADFIFNGTGVINGFDSLGHFARSNVQVSNCINIEAIVVQGCEAFFGATVGAASASAGEDKRAEPKTGIDAPVAPGEPAPTEVVPEVEQIPELDPEEPAEEPTETEPPADEQGTPGEDAGAEADADASEAADPDAEDRKRTQRGATDPSEVSMRQASMFLDFLLGSGL